MLGTTGWCVRLHLVDAREEVANAQLGAFGPFGKAVARNSSAAACDSTLMLLLSSVAVVVLLLLVFHLSICRKRVKVTDDSYSPVSRCRLSSPSSAAALKARLASGKTESAADYESPTQQQDGTARGVDPSGLYGGAREAEADARSRVIEQQRSNSTKAGRQAERQRLLAQQQLRSDHSVSSPSKKGVSARLSSLSARLAAVSTWTGGPSPSTRKPKQTWANFPWTFAPVINQSPSHPSSPYATPRGENDAEEAAYGGGGIWVPPYFTRAVDAFRAVADSNGSQYVSRVQLPPRSTGMSYPLDPIGITYPIDHIGPSSATAAGHEPR